MTRALFGYTGFVGSNLLQFFKFDYFFNSSNILESQNMFFDEIFFCAIPAVKWLANKHPEQDAETINNIKQILKTVKTNKFVLISTIDVYDDPNSMQTETYDCDIFLNHAYGRNRYIFEEFVKTSYTNYNIIRLPAIFGKGLKKNIIYDLIHNNNINQISPNTSFQWYDLNWLGNDIATILKHDIKCCNLFTEPLASFDIISLFDYPIEVFENKSNACYNLCTNYSNLFESNIKNYIRGNKEVLHNIKIFISNYKRNTSQLMVSNICVQHISQFQFANLLKLFNIKFVQIAPTTLIKSWDNLDSLDLSIYTKNNIIPFSYQSILYGSGHLNIFNVETHCDLKSHLFKIINNAHLNQIKILVFGCPQNRKVLDNDIDNDLIFINFFKDIAMYIQEKHYDVTICIEPNSKAYGCNYINNILHANKLVKQINSNKIMMMVDMGNMLMENENITDIFLCDKLYNVDIANAQMLPLNTYENYHKDIINVLRQIEYKNKINLEMKINVTDEKTELVTLVKSLNNFIKLCVDV